MNKILYHLECKLCPKCKKVISARPPDILAKCLYENSVVLMIISSIQDDITVQRL